MSKQILIALAAAGVLAVAGCQSAPTTTAAAAPTISDEAKAALAKAEADTKAADAKKALWTTAQDALKAAQEAAKKGDSAAVLKNAKLASDHSKMGLDQKAYPLMTLSK
jgi:murein lipoprotein